MEDTLPDQTVIEMLAENARRFPHKVALRQKQFGIWHSITWADYHQRALAFGKGLQHLGLSRGSHLAILSENNAEWVIGQLGAGTIGAVTVGVYPTSPAGEIAYVLEHSDAEAIICEDQEQLDKVLEVRAQLPRLRHIIVVDPKGLRSYPQGTFQTFSDIEASGLNNPPASVPEPEGFVSSMEDTALIIYTSGSTGKPKGAMLSYANMRAQAEAAIDRLGFSNSTVTLSYLPLCHVAEQLMTVMAPLYAQSCVCFGESIQTVNDDLRELAPNLFLGVPRIWEKMQSSINIKLMEAGVIRRWIVNRAIAACEPYAETAPKDRTLTEKLRFALYYLLVFRALQNFLGLRKTRLALTGAAPIPPTVVRFFRTIGIPLVEVYGMTESSGVATAQTVENLVPSCVGDQVRNAEVKIDDISGELLVRGPIVFKGYYKNDQATQSTIRDGWLHTGDVATTEHGQIKIVDRIKDIMITAGGKNLSPSEIENTIKGSPYIKECIVIAEGRKYVSALIQIDPETVGKWAEEHRIAFTTFRDLAEKPEVLSLISDEVDKGNSQMAQVAHVRKFHLLRKELDHDDNEMTATMKVRRKSVFEGYAAEIEALY